MTEATAAAVVEVTPPSSLSDDPDFDFTTTEWVIPPLLFSHKDDSPAELKRRQQQEHVYRSKTTPTNWNRYLALGRYALSGPDFDLLMNRQVEDALLLHCVIWYNYAFHVDRNMECSLKLAAWAVQQSKPYLNTHQTNALLVDTISTRWKQYAKDNDKPSAKKSQDNVKTVVDLTDDAASDDYQLTTMEVQSDEEPFDFTVVDWMILPKYVFNLPETTQDSDIRALAEAEYRKSTTPTTWHRYVTLGRYVVDGFTFDSIMNKGSIEPQKMNCLIWYQYSYYLDNNLDIPSKLQLWAASRSQPFLAKHALLAFNLTPPRLHGKSTLVPFPSPTLGQK